MTRINVAVYCSDYLYMATFVQLRRYCGSGIFLKIKLLREKHIYSVYYTQFLYYIACQFFSSSSY